MIDHRHFDGNTLVIASHNKGKVREIGELLEPFGVKTISAGDLDLPEPVEDGDSFIANAEIKAIAAAKAANLPALSDDSGLEVVALNGEPGIFSARWGGPEKDFTLAMHKVNEAMGNNENRTANFTCALTLAWPDGHMESFEGKVFGSITWPMRGNKGFGYDPFFIPDGYDMTFAEMEPAKKHAMSHRADAFKQLIDACFKN
ncbi:RdgB/HAM1 family non-canonical purine NTP pyrophosphatase [Kordiimonas sp. SCSIO 12610]|uniref:RdgB/HAM1 family non-canonical purine NTP pyrophosphatase n=1 Tax=Kordiimonas sp. SCSIO 12610 TaxID=2829597 RepID=UPI00210D704A|nr:RdgB/HAM1 family non-canonical purine NTP pyrophosphatase [Kordiimonas sp. SCSIO 12610]UTW55486.1 RdgB/HAM1 family non-canonical purine NTP pyrophosphatase [Kordiimonas sp. SCSIO 12610]